jgi:phosphopantothenoylcysteine decarboxylase/phosphopantothenate--cysteine ligase
MGPMRSRLDSVRYLQNESSGKMGLELVRALVRAGLVPQVMVGPVEEDVRSQLASLVGAEQVKAFVDDADYARLVADASRACDIFFSAAAVLDFAFENAAVAKLDKTQLDAAFKLRPVEDFAASFGRDKRDGQWLVSFSAEVEDDDRALLERALGKKLAKNAEWTLVNRVSSDSGPNAAASEAWILNPDQGIVYLGESRSKREIADELVSEIQRAWELR